MNALMKVRMNRSALYVRVLGVLTCLYGLASIALVGLNRYAAAHGGRDLSSLLAPAAVVLVIGAGLLCLARWAILVAALVMAIAGSVMGVGSIATVPMPYALINIFTGIVLVGLAAIAIVSWRDLRAKGI